MNRAFVLTNGLFHTDSAKTTHGLIRNTTRFSIEGVIDGRQLAGRDAGIELDGVHRNIPIYATLAAALKQAGQPVEYLIIGIATKGGVIPEDISKVVRYAIRRGLSIVNGLHQFLSADKAFSRLAFRHNVRLIDIRKPKPFHELKFWSGKIKEVRCPIVAVLGTDCKLGKRTTAQLLRQACNEGDIKAEMIYTGQTGWMQGNEYGFVFDATPNDFVAGELEDAIYRCYTEKAPDLVILEGQSALRNPSGPAGAEFILSGHAKHVILQHSPARIYYNNDQELGYALPSLESEIELIARYGARVIAIALNSEGMGQGQLKQLKQEYVQRFRVPVIDPLKESAALVPVISTLFLQHAY